MDPFVIAAALVGTIAIVAVILRAIRAHNRAEFERWHAGYYARGSGGSVGQGASASQAQKSGSSYPFIYDGGGSGYSGSSSCDSGSSGGDSGGCGGGDGGGD